MSQAQDEGRPFRFSIDRGGTFTDVYAEVPGPKGFRVLKLLSEDPQNYPDAPREGVRRILEVSLGVGLILPLSQFGNNVGWEMGVQATTCRSLPCSCWRPDSCLLSSPRPYR